MYISVHSQEKNLPVPIGFGEQLSDNMSVRCECTLRDTMENGEGGRKCIQTLTGVGAMISIFMNQRVLCSGCDGGAQLFRPYLLPATTGAGPATSNLSTLPSNDNLAASSRGATAPVPCGPQSTEADLIPPPQDPSSDLGRVGLHPEDDLGTEDSEQTTNNPGSSSSSSMMPEKTGGDRAPLQKDTVPPAKPTEMRTQAIATPPPFPCVLNLFFFFFESKIIITIRRRRKRRR